MAAQREG